MTTETTANGPVVTREQEIAKRAACLAFNISSRTNAVAELRSRIWGMTAYDPEYPGAQSVLAEFQAELDARKRELDEMIGDA